MESLLTNETQESLGQNQKKEILIDDVSQSKRVLNTAIETCNKAPRVNGWLENMKRISLFQVYNPLTISQWNLEVSTNWDTYIQSLS